MSCCEIMCELTAKAQVSFCACTHRFCPDSKSKSNRILWSFMTPRQTCGSSRISSVLMESCFYSTVSNEILQDLQTFPKKPPIGSLYEEVQVLVGFPLSYWKSDLHQIPSDSCKLKNPLCLYRLYIPFIILFFWFLQDSQSCCFYFLFLGLTSILNFLDVSD